MASCTHDHECEKDTRLSEEDLAGERQTIFPFEVVLYENTLISKAAFGPR